MHAPPHSSSARLARVQTREIAYILDPYYHIEPASTSSASPSSPSPSYLSCRSEPCPSSTWTDTMGEHDPDFRPFVSTRRMSFQSPSSPRPSFDYHIPSTSTVRPSKAVRTAARLKLPPHLQLAVARNEAKPPRKFPFLRRRKSLDEQDDVVFDDEEEEEDLSAYSPPPLPELVLDDDENDDAEDEEEQAQAAAARKRPSRVDHIRRHFIGLTLRVDLAVFRAKRHLRGRLGLD